MIANEILLRTFAIGTQGKTGTGTAIEVAGRQYIATAAHVVPGLAAGGVLTVHRQASKLEEQAIRSLPVPGVVTGGAPGKYQVPVKGVWRHPSFQERTVRDAAGDDREEYSGIDVAVIALEHLIVFTPHVLELTAHDLAWSQDVYFVGFAFGRVTTKDTAGYPIPYARKGIVSYAEEDGAGSEKFTLDATCNYGFSGGPLLYESQVERGVMRMAGVIEGFHQSESLGLVLANNIKYVVAGAQALSCGPRLTKDQRTAQLELALRRQ